MHFADKLWCRGTLVTTGERLKYFRLENLPGFFWEKRDNISATPLALLYG